MLQNRWVSSRIGTRRRLWRTTHSALSACWVGQDQHSSRNWLVRCQRLDGTNIAMRATKFS
ncbi:MAG: hypothetical protein EBQ64_01225, partial [Acidimicrobiia bacterium]|nr:hypothetical protein [Acidimicrobiia bacterium]